MSKKIAVSLLLLLLGLASWDAVSNIEDSSGLDESGRVRISSDGTQPPR
jgi:hypothetical protein